MGVIQSFSGSSVLTKVVLLLLLLAQICSWIAFTIPEWARTGLSPNLVTYTGLGLWRQCSYNGPTSAPSPCAQLDGSRLDWFTGVQALAVLGFLGINIAFIIVVLQVFSSQCKGVNDIGLINGIQCIVTGIFYLIGIIVFAVEFDEGYYGIVSGTRPKIGELGFSFGLAIVAVILGIVSGVLMIVDQRKGAGTSPA